MSLYYIHDEFEAMPIFIMGVATTHYQQSKISSLYLTLWLTTQDRRLAVASNIVSVKLKAIDCLQTESEAYNALVHGPGMACS